MPVNDPVCGDSLCITARSVLWERQGVYERLPRPKRVQAVIAHHDSRRFTPDSRRETVAYPLLEKQQTQLAAFVEG